MVIRKVVIVNAQPVKGNFATRKHYHLKQLVNLSFETFNSG